MWDPERYLVSLTDVCKLKRDAIALPGQNLLEPSSDHASTNHGPLIRSLSANGTHLIFGVSQGVCLRLNVQVPTAAAAPGSPHGLDAEVIPEKGSAHPPLARRSVPT